MNNLRQVTKDGRCWIATDRYPAPQKSTRGLISGERYARFLVDSLITSGAPWGIHRAGFEPEKRTYRLHFS